MRSSHRMERYSATKDNEILILDTTRMNFQNKMLRYRKPGPKGQTVHDSTHTKYLTQRNSQTQTVGWS